MVRRVDNEVPTTQSSTPLSAIGECELEVARDGIWIYPR